MTPTSKDARQAGFTLIEALAVVVVLVAVMGVVVTSLLSGQKALSQGMTNAEVEENARRAMMHMLPELRQSGKNDPTFFPDYDEEPLDSDLEVEDPGPTTGTTVSFRKNEGFTIDGSSPEGRIAWSDDLIVYGFELDDGESDNGADDDGDGIADDGYLYRLEDDEEVIFARNILDSFELELDETEQELSIYLQAAKRLEDGSIKVFEHTEKVLLRN